MLRDTLVALLQPVVEGLGYVLWELEFVPGRGSALLRLYIDSPDGITVDDCERVSRAVSEVLDAEDPVPGHYTLEVSSPGLDRPLKKLPDYVRFAGEEAQVNLREPADGARRWKGTLRGVADGNVLLETATGTRTIPFDAIDRCRLVPKIEWRKAK